MIVIFPDPGAWMPNTIKWSPHAVQGINSRLLMNTVWEWGRGLHCCTITLRSQCDIPAAGGQIQLLSSLQPKLPPQAMQRYCSSFVPQLHRESGTSVGGGGGEVGLDRTAKMGWCCIFVSLMMFCLHLCEVRVGGRCESASSTLGICCEYLRTLSYFMCMEKADCSL